MTVRSRRRRVLASLALVATAWAATCVAFPSALGGFSPVISNDTNSAAIATSSTTCASTAVADGAYFTYPFNETSGTTVADVSGNSRPGTYNNPTAAMYGVANTGAGAVCPADNKSVITLNGSNQYVSGPATAVTGPTAFSVEIWFIAKAAQGRLIGFGNARTGASAATTNDRVLYINTSGYLAFGVYSGGTRNTITAPYGSTYVVGGSTWHQAIATLSPTAGTALYVDGALVASNASYKTAGSYSGYWKIGYDDLSSWPAPPFSPYFSGSLAFASVYTYALTATQVSAHYAAGR